MQATSSTNIVGTSSNNSSLHNSNENDSSWDSMAVGYTYQTSQNLNVDEKNDNEKFAKFATLASWAVNWFLLISKIICFIISDSKAVLAALADSAVDLVSQAVLSTAERYISKHNPDYPIGIV